jgi:adenine/guanine phosphoribosyltransferase-like PRPP-binding protein
MACPQQKLPSRSEVLGDHYGVIPKYLGRHLAALKKAIRGSGVTFNALAFSGYSGAFVAAPLSLALKKPMVMVRKVGEATHGIYPYRVIGPTVVRSYVIVDDLIDSGRTVTNILEAMKEAYPTAECRGVFLYNCLNYQDEQALREKVPADIPLFPGSIQYPF